MNNLAMKVLGVFCAVISLSSLVAVATETSDVRGSFHAVSLSAGLYDNAKGSPILDLIHGAHSKLDIEVYEMDDPQVIGAIRDALNRRVVVHIVKEPAPVGAACKVFDSVGNADDAKSGGGSATCDDQRQLVRDVRRAGGVYVPFKKPDLCGGDGSKSCLEHGKVAIADAQVAMVSSGNFNTTNLCDLKYSPNTCNRDYSFLTTDPDVVGTLQRVIENDLKGQRYDVGTVMSPSAANKVTVGPNSLSPLVALIRSARSRIRIQNQYLKEPTINAALIEAAKRGVQVLVMVSSACSFGLPSDSESKQLTAIFTSFDRAKIATRMFTKNIRINGMPGYLHAKAIVVDDRVAWMGSVNGSTQATTLNREFGVFFNTPGDVSRLAGVMNQDFTDPHAESWQDSLRCAEHN